MERLRQTLVGAMKSGNTFVLYLGGCTYEHADWKKKLCKKDTFPTDTFTDSGRKLLKVHSDPDPNPNPNHSPNHSPNPNLVPQPSINPKYKLLYREADLEEGEAIIRDGFKVVVVSSLGPHAYEEALESTLPLGYMQPLYLRV